MWWIYLIVALVVLLVLVLVGVCIIYVRNYWHFLNVPHDQPQSLLQIYKTLREYGSHVDPQQRCRHYQQLYERFKGTGPFCGFYDLLEPGILVLDRELVQMILIKDFSNFNDRGRYYNSKSDPLSADLYSLSGCAWKEMRLKLEPIFRSSQIQTVHHIVNCECENLLCLIDHKLQQNSLKMTNEDPVMDVKPLIHRFVLATLAKTVFGLNSGTPKQKYPVDSFDAMTQMALQTQRHGRCVTALMRRYPELFRHLGFATTKQSVHDYFLALISDTIEQRDNGDDHVTDYLQSLIDIMTQELSTRETEQDEKALREHLIAELLAHAFSFLRAGLEPTANTIALVLWELAANRPLQQRAREEVSNARHHHHNVFSSECVQSLQFLGQVISETLRMHPITPYITRRALNDYLVPNHPNYLIRKNQYIIIPVQALHNDPTYYPEPHIFKPERFSEANDRSRAPCVWLGFGEGPRNCVGVHFAQFQMRLVLAHLLSRYEFACDVGSRASCCSESVPLRVRNLVERKEFIEYEGRESAVVI